MSVGLESRGQVGLESRGPGPAPVVAALDDLYDYGAARGVSFVPLAASRPGGSPAHDAALVDSLEADLEQARMALSALEEAGAEARLSRVEAALLAHPHLPEAAFLMAECLALQAQAVAPRDASLAASLRARRAALEGPRAAAFGESASDAAAAPLVSLPITGVAAADEIELDGVQHGPAERRVALVPGLHHVRVFRAGRLLLAKFVEVLSDQTALALPAPQLAPCSYDDLSVVSRELLANGARPPPGVACQRWALARPEPGGVGVAMCGPASCGPFVHWQRRRPVAFTPLIIDRSRLPAWAGFAIAGAATVAGASLVLWQSGALDRGQRAATTLEYGGFNP